MIDKLDLDNLMLDTKNGLRTQFLIIRKLRIIRKTMFNSKKPKYWVLDCRINDMSCRTLWRITKTTSGACLELGKLNIIKGARIATFLILISELGHGTLRTPGVKMI